MCQDIDHGGVRCPTDTSEARRLRRKASHILGSAAKSETVKKAASVSEPIVLTSLDVLKERAEELRKDAHGPTPEGLTQGEWDSQIESRVTRLGMQLGAEADKIAGFDDELLAKKFEAEAYTLYNEYNDEQRVFNKKLTAAHEEWDAVVDKYIDISGGLFNRFTRVHDLNSDQEKFLTEDDFKVVELVEGLTHEGNAARLRYKEIDVAYNAFQDKEYAEQNKKLADAYVEVLSHVRPLGGDIKFSTTEGDVEAQQIMNTTVGKHYPTAWLEAHSEADGSSMVVAFDTSGRASYNATSFSETEDDGVVKNVASVGVISTSNAWYANKVKELYETDDAYTVKMIRTKDWMDENYYGVHVIYNGEELWKEKYHGELVDGKPVGEGWVFKNSITSCSDLDTQGGKDDTSRVDFLSQKVWVKPVSTTKKQVKLLSIYSPEQVSKLPQSSKALYDVTSAVAYHEFGHRMEEVLPNNVLPRQEKAFLQRRTGKSDENWLSGMKTTGASSEFVHDADLPSAYAGRDYLTGENYEVFTVGVESLYGGAYGGLMGNTKDFLKKDEDYRGFVLGTLAAL